MKKLDWTIPELSFLLAGFSVVFAGAAEMFPQRRQFFGWIVAALLLQFVVVLVVCAFIDRK